MFKLRFTLKYTNESKHVHENVRYLSLASLLSPQTHYNDVFPYGDLRRMANRVVAQGPGIQVGAIVMRYHHHQVENLSLYQCPYREPNEVPWG